MGALHPLLLVGDLGDNRRALLLFAEALELLLEHASLTLELLAASLTLERGLLWCQRRRGEFGLEFADAAPLPLWASASWRGSPASTSPCSPLRCASTLFTRPSSSPSCALKPVSSASPCLASVSSVSARRSRSAAAGSEFAARAAATTVSARTRRSSATLASSGSSCVSSASRASIRVIDCWRAFSPSAGREGARNVPQRWPRTRPRSLTWPGRSPSCRSTSPR